MPKETVAIKMICPLSMANPSSNINCTGSKCMAWEFYNQQLPMRRFQSINPDALFIEESGGRPENCPEHYEFHQADEDIAYWVEPEDEWRSRFSGYCKLIQKTS